MAIAPMAWQICRGMFGSGAAICMFPTLIANRQGHLRLPFDRKVPPQHRLAIWRDHRPGHRVGF